MKEFTPHHMLDNFRAVVAESCLYLFKNKPKIIFIASKQTDPQSKIALA